MLLWNLANKLDKSDHQNWLTFALLRRGSESFRQFRLDFDILSKMLRTLHPILPSAARFYSTINPEKPSLKLVAELRKRTEVSITKAREALKASSNDIETALQWLQEDNITSGAKKAAKVEGRTAKEGLISTSTLSRGVKSRAELGDGGIRAAMVELNCETDFVGRNELFGRLAADIAHTAAYISEPAVTGTTFRQVSLDALNDAPLISEPDPQALPSTTVGSAIRELIAKVGEKVALRRAVAVVENPSSQVGLRLASYHHGSIHNMMQGRIGTLALLALKSPKLHDLLGEDAFCSELERLERSLARQIVGFETRCVSAPEGSMDESALYNQPFMMFAGDMSGHSVRQVLQAWASQHGLTESSDANGLAVLDFTKWTVGEPLDNAADT